MKQVSLMCPNGINYLTAVDAGGLSAGNANVAISSDATGIGNNELFELIVIDFHENKYALRTRDGQFVTFVNEGGIGGPNSNQSPIHTDATKIGPWEKFTLIHQQGKVAIQTGNGKNYLSAVNGGGVGGPNSTPIHTDANWVKEWEILTIVKA